VRAVLEGAEDIGVHVTIANELRGKISAGAKLSLGRDTRHILIGFGAGRRGELRGNTARLDAIDGRLWDGVGVIAEIVFDMRAILTNVIGPNNPSIFEMDNVGIADGCQTNYEQ
jgi:hypothetical protein